MKYRQFYWGMILIVAGALFLLHQTGIFPMDLRYLITTFWPLIIIYYCLKGILVSKKDANWNGSMIWNLFGLFIGLYFLGRNLGYIHQSLGQLIPYMISIGLILFGLKMVFKPSNKQYSSSESEWETKYEDKETTYDSYETDYTSDSTSEYTKTDPPQMNNNTTENKSSFIGD